MSLGRRLTRSPWIVPAAITVVGTALLALDGLHYWHDARFLFVATRFPFDEILSGRFNPHQSWGTIDETSSAGFYASKMLHLWLLQRVLALTSDPLIGVRLAVGFSVATMAVAALGVQRLIGLLTGRSDLGWLGLAAFLLVPVVPYLAGKQLSGITALALGTWGSFLAMRVILLPTSRRTYETFIASGLFLAASLARLDSVLGIAALFVGAWVAFDHARARIRHVALVTLFVVAGGQALALLAAGVSPGRYSDYLLAFVDAPGRPAVMSILSLAVFGGWAYPLAASALLSSRARLRLLFLVWGAVAWVPMIALTSNFMVEPRYLVLGLVPFTGLVVLGAEALGSRLPPPSRARIAAMVVLIALGSNWVAIRLMPTELDRPALLQAVREIRTEAADASILVPWAYTDASFLRVVLPREPIYSVHSPRGLGVSEDLERRWHGRYVEWYEGHHIADDETLDALLAGHPVYYLGWHRYPPIEFVTSAAEGMGWRGLAERLRRMDLLDHLETSWVRDRPDLRFEPAGSVGQYLYFRVVRDVPAEIPEER